MIVGDIKPLEEIVANVKDYTRILVVGCGGCVSVCLSGGYKEARTLAQELSNIRHYEGDPPRVEVETIERQCEPDWLSTYLKIPEHVEAVLSLACGAGVQTMAAVFEPLPVIPALNTTFMGATTEPGVWGEMCQGCGDCVLSFTGGICPVARCAKSLFNGPCGGSQNGACEIYTDTPCAWTLIYYRLKKQHKLHRMQEIKPVKDWQPGGAAGPREFRRTGMATGYPKKIPT
jgi:ferredoxin